MTHRPEADRAVEVTQRGRWSRTIFARIAGLMTLAMLPLGLISIYQTRAVIEDGRTLSTRALLATTIAAAAEKREVIEYALGAAKGLGAVVPELDIATCKSVLATFVESDTNYIFAGYVEADGMMRCSSTGAEIDFAGSPEFNRAVSLQAPIISSTPSGAVTKQPVVISTQPVFRGTRLRGFIVLSIPHAVTVDGMQTSGAQSGFALASVNAAGAIIATSVEGDAQGSFLPDIPDLTTLRDEVGQTFHAVSVTGEERFYSVAPMIDDALFLVGSWPREAIPDDQSMVQGTVATLFPVLMWIAGLGVALFGMRRLVTRHIAELRSAMRRFALGDLGAEPLRLTDAPVELEDAERAFNRMVIILQEAEDRQKRDLADKEVLLREVHHRVKNNLQIIASIVNMQARKAESEEVQHVLTGLGRRVRAMAMLHLTFFNTPNTATLAASDIVEAVVRDVKSGLAGAPAPDITLSVDPVELYPDQAIPLSLLLSEILHLRIAAQPQEHPAEVAVSLSAEGSDRMALSVTSPARSDAADAGISAQLIRAFERQLEGEAAQRAEGAQMVYQLVFSSAASDAG